MTNRMTAIVVDDHPLVAQATKHLLAQIERLEVIGVAGNAGACMEMVAAHHPGLVFLDYQLPDDYGTRVISRIKEESPDTHIVIFTGNDVQDLYDRFIELKVSGILSKESTEVIIKQMIECILDGYTILPLPVFHQMRLSAKPLSESGRLTVDELAIMAAVVKGTTHEQIADQVHMSKRSVDNYLKKIYEKLGVSSKAQAIEKYVQSEYYRTSERSE